MPAPGNDCQVGMKIWTESSSPEPGGDLGWWDICYLKISYVMPFRAAFSVLARLNAFLWLSPLGPKLMYSIVSDVYLATALHFKWKLEREKSLKESLHLSNHWCMQTQWILRTSKNKHFGLTHDIILGYSWHPEDLVFSHFIKSKELLNIVDKTSHMLPWLRNKIIAF